MSLHSRFKEMIQNRIHLRLRISTVARRWSLLPWTHLSALVTQHTASCTCLLHCGDFTHERSLRNQIFSSSYCPCFFYQIQNNTVLLQDTREYLCCSLLQVTCSCRLSKAKLLRDCFGVCSEDCGGYYYPSRCSSKRPRKFSVAPVCRHNKQLH